MDRWITQEGFIQGIVLRRLSLDAADIIERYSAGASIEELAEQYRCNPQTMRRFLIASEVEIRPKPRKMKLEPFEAELIAAYSSGAKVAELAAHYRVGVRTVQTFIRRKLGP